MADTARGKISMTPVVTIAADDDSAAVDAIHHDINGLLGGVLEYEKADANDKWFYDASKTIDTTNSTNIISGDFTQGGAAHVNDDVRYICIVHTGLDSSGDASTDNVYVVFDGNASPSGQPDAAVIGPNEAFIQKTNTSCNVEDIHAETSSGEAVVKVAAIIDDNYVP